MQFPIKLSAALTVLFTLSLFTFANIHTANATADGPDYYKVRNVEYWDVLNIRKWPSHKSRIIDIIPSDGRGIRNEVRYVRGWCLINYHGTQGWVNCKYLAEDY